MKFMIKLICLCLALAPVVSSAKLGDNEWQVSHVYGNQTGQWQLSESLLARRYSFNEMAVTVAFLYGASQCEEFRKLDGSDFTEEEISLILEENSNRLAWVARTPFGPVQEWIIPSAAPSADSPSSKEQAVLAISPKQVSAEGTKMVAVGVLKPDDRSSSASIAPAVLRRAVYKTSETNNVLVVFTSAYENVVKRELACKPQSSLSGK